MSAATCHDPANQSERARPAIGGGVVRRTRRTKRRIADALRQAARGYSIHDPARDPTWIRPSQLIGTSRVEPYADSAWVYRCIRVLADNAASTPFRLYTGPEGDATPVTSGPWFDLFRRPNPMLSGPELFWSTVAMKNLDGEVFWVLRGRGDRLMPGEIPSEIWPTGKTSMREHVSPTTGLVESWSLMGSRGEVDLMAHEVIQHRFIDPANPIRGMSPLRAAMESVVTALKSERWNKRMLENNAVPGGVLSGATGFAQTDAQLDRERHRWNKAHQGVENVNTIAIMPEGTTFTAVGQTAKDMEWLAALEWDRQKVATIYGLTLFMLGIVGDVHRETSEQARKLFWVETERPLLETISGTIDTQLFFGRGAGSRVSSMVRPGTVNEVAVSGAFDYSGIPELQRAMAERLADAAAGLKLGIPLNQLIEAHGLPYEPQEHGDEGLLSMGLAPVATIHADLDLGPDVAATVPDDSALAGIEPQGDQSVEVLEDLVLNGAQIMAALSIVLAVVDGKMPRDSGVGQLIVLFNLGEGQAESIMGSAGKPDVPTTPNPVGGDEPSGQDDDDEPDDEDGKDEPRANPWKHMPGVDRALTETYRVSRDPGGYMVWTGNQRAARREKLWQSYVRFVIRPSERKIIRIVGSYLNARAREVIAALGKFERSAVDGIAFDDWLLEQDARWRAMLAGSTKPVTGQTVARSLGHFSTALGDGFTPITMEHPDVLRFLGTSDERYKTISGNQTERVRRTVARALAEGEGLQGAVKAVKATYQVDHSKALTIGRTESGVAAQTPAYQAMRSDGVLRGEWLSAGDEEVRATGEAFSNGLLHPNDPLGAAENVINCRCCWSPIVED
jgi:HK97 family phage portal protein